uniref:RETRotransposonlike family member (Retr1)like [Saccoglossus kowalevskii] n=1 Tax=Lepeophtheirus salmonis TaxID=72036 RepID=A0A0K2V0G6_LEPSM
MMGRRLNTNVPVAACQLSPIVIPSQALHQLEENKKTGEKINFDRRHAAKPLITLQKRDEVVIPDRRQSGIVIRNSTPRSYIIETDTGSYRRNRVLLSKMASPCLGNSKFKEINQDAKDPVPAVLKETVTKSGRASKPQRSTMIMFKVELIHRKGDGEYVVFISLIIYYILCVYSFMSVYAFVVCLLASQMYVVHM